MKTLLAVCYTGSSYRTITVQKVTGWRTNDGRPRFVQQAPDEANMEWFLAEAATTRNVCIYPNDDTSYAGKLSADNDTPLYTCGQETVKLLVADGKIIWGAGGSYYTQFVGQSFAPPVDSYLEGRNITELIERYSLETATELC